MARRLPERPAEPGAGGAPPAELFDGAVTTRMVAFIEVGDPPGGHAAFRRLKVAQQEWLVARGYVRASGHVDWVKFCLDFNRAAYNRPAA